MHLNPSPFDYADLNAQLQAARMAALGMSVQMAQGAVPVADLSTLHAKLLGLETRIQELETLVRIAWKLHVCDQMNMVRQTSQGPHFISATEAVHATGR